MRPPLFPRTRGAGGAGVGGGDLIGVFEVELVSVSPEQAHTARAAYRDFGKGSGHPAGLNFGDCFSYALASVTGEPLLFSVAAESP